MSDTKHIISELNIVPQITPDKRVVLDQCLDGMNAVEQSPLEIAFSRIFGIAKRSTQIAKIGASDARVFEVATTEKADAIITLDGKAAAKEDLCFIANRAYQGDAENLPGIIVVPGANSKFTTLGRIADSLAKHQDRVFNYLNSNPQAVLDLREFRF